MPAVESRDALLGKSSAPTSDKTTAAVDALRHFIPGMAFGQQQDQPCPSGIFGPSRRLKARRVNSLSSEFVRVIASLMDTIIVYKWLLQSTSTYFLEQPLVLIGHQRPEQLFSGPAFDATAHKG